ncbi:MAG: hypothetical protein AAFR35_05655 [Pseudomonadota bacterium]
MPERMHMDWTLPVLEDIREFLVETGRSEAADRVADAIAQIREQIEDERHIDLFYELAKETPDGAPQKKRRRH